MKYMYTKTFFLPYSEVGLEGKLSIYEASCLTQDMSTEFFESLQLDNFRICEKYNAAWVITKSKYVFHKFPQWHDKIIAKSYIASKSELRIDTCSDFYDANNELLFCCKQEFCIIDRTQRSLKKLSNINFPEDICLYETSLQSPYARIKCTFDENEKVCAHLVHSTDIDFTNHVNNTKYIYYIMSTFSSEFLKSNFIKEFDIAYLGESKEGNLLEVYEKDELTEKIFCIKNDGKEIIKGKICFA